MTFQKAQEIFATKYPEGELVQHGKFGGTEKNRKITVIFHRNTTGYNGSKCYEYYGAYEDVLCRIGFKVISKERLAEMKLRLETVKEWHGKAGFFGGVVDNSEEIARLEKRIAEYESGEWIIA